MLGAYRPARDSPKADYSTSSASFRTKRSRLKAGEGDVQNLWRRSSIWCCVPWETAWFTSSSMQLRFHTSPRSESERNLPE